MNDAELQQIATTYAALANSGDTATASALIGSIPSDLIGQFGQALHAITNH